jgi:hypothetical protein
VNCHDSKKLGLAALALPNDALYKIFGTRNARKTLQKATRVEEIRIVLKSI